MHGLPMNLHVFPGGRWGGGKALKNFERHTRIFDWSFPLKVSMQKFVPCICPPSMAVYGSESSQIAERRGNSHAGLYERFRGS